MTRLTDKHTAAELKRNCDGLRATGTMQSEFAEWRHSAKVLKLLDGEEDE